MTKRELCIGVIVAGFLSLAAGIIVQTEMTNKFGVTKTTLESIK